MNQELLARLRQITDEERAILAGDATVRRSLYTTRHEFVVDSARLLEKGKLIEIRPHTRFVHFPRHRHNYVQRKLQQAAYLLSHTPLPVESILENIGYENSSYFYRRFRARYGCSPAEYRASRSV